MPSSSETPTKNTYTDTYTDPEIRAFYASLDPKDRLIHELAVKLLKTRYSPKRSNAYRAFLAAKK